MSGRLVAVTGFGSLWRRRFDTDQDDSHRFARGVYYNTTGVEIAGTIRQRPKITGYARFHACGEFDPQHPSRMIGRVFRCAEPCVWKGDNKLVFQRLLSAPEKPDCILVVLRNGVHGVLRIDSQNWRSADSWLISFSECRDKQEAMLLMPADGWIETKLGRFVLEPRTQQPWAARLILIWQRRRQDMLYWKGSIALSPIRDYPLLRKVAAVNVYQARSIVRIHAAGILCNIA